MNRNEDPDGILLGGVLIMLLAFLDSSCAWIGGIVIILFGIKSMMNNPVFSKKMFSWHNIGYYRKYTRTMVVINVLRASGARASMASV